MLHSTVSDVLEEKVIAGSNNEHKGGPSDNSSLMNVVFTLNVFSEVLWLPLEGIHHTLHL